MKSNRLSRQIRSAKHALWVELVRAVKYLRNMAANKLADIRRLFRYYTSQNRALRQVVQYYIQKSHPCDGRVPASLLEAFAIVGLEMFVHAKEIGEAIRAKQGLSESQKQFAKTFFVSVASDGLPVGRDLAEHRYYRRSSTRPPQGWSAMPARA